MQAAGASTRPRPGPRFSWTGTPRCDQHRRRDPPPERAGGVRRARAPGIPRAGDVPLQEPCRPAHLPDDARVRRPGRASRGEPGAVQRLPGRGARLEPARTRGACGAAAAVLPRLRPARRGVRSGHGLPAHPGHPGAPGRARARGEPDRMTPEQEDAAIIRELVAIFPEVEEQATGLDLVYEVAGAFALCLRDLIRAGADTGNERVRRAFALLDDLARRKSVNAQEIAAFG